MTIPPNKKARHCWRAHVVSDGKTAYDLSQHLHAPRHITFNPAKITRIEMVIQKGLDANMSKARSSTITPIRMMNTPHILWQKQPHFLVSQHFFSSVVSMTDFLSVFGCIAGATSEISHAAAAFDAAKSALRSLRLLKNS
jgi:hypothetical protein